MAKLTLFDDAQRDLEGEGFYYKNKKYIPHTDLSISESAFFQLTKGQLALLITLTIICLVALFLSWHLTIVIIFAALTILYFCDLLFNVFLVGKSLTKSSEIKITSEQIEERNKLPWPKYTIFCPLYKEWQVLPQFCKAMQSLDYPQSQLQIMLLLEENDPETIQKAREMNLPFNFHIQVVPHSLPKTKPKAMNFGLKHASGKYLVIYDAEDIPDPLQLKKAVIAFESSDPEIVCMQAKLNFYNPTQNMLTKMFTAEYSLWFDLILTGLQTVDSPIPLGGTSNHFRVNDLKEFKGWDPFNVTEDCDLGIRMAKKGFKTAIIDSTTLEEANSDLRNWFEQRTRWNKGYVQTYLVHMRKSHWRGIQFFTFQLVVGGKILSMLINPLLWLITLSYFLFRSTLGPVIESFYPPTVLYIGVFCLIFGNFFYMYNYMIGCVKKGHDNLVRYTLFIPLYWLFMSAAAWVSIIRLIYQPHYWSKTKHGLHLKTKQESVQLAN